MKHYKSILLIKNYFVIKFWRYSKIIFTEIHLLLNIRNDTFPSLIFNVLRIFHGLFIQLSSATACFQEKHWQMEWYVRIFAEKIPFDFDHVCYLNASYFLQVFILLFKRVINKNLHPVMCISYWYFFKLNVTKIFNLQYSCSITYLEFVFVRDTNSKHILLYDKYSLSYIFWFLHSSANCVVVSY